MGTLLDAILQTFKRVGRPINLQGVTKVGDVVFDSRKGLGSMPVNSNINYQGIGMMMRPEDFIRLNPPRVDRPVESLLAAIQQGNPIGPPYLKTHFDPADMTLLVKGHEGRGRAMSLRRLQPDVQMPVHVEMREIDPLTRQTWEMRSRNIDPERVLRSTVLPDTFNGAPNYEAQAFSPRAIIHNDRVYFRDPNNKILDITDDVANL